LSPQMWVSFSSIVCAGIGSWPSRALLYTCYLCANAC
jgi:hypothetical protein